MTIRKCTLLLLLFCAWCDPDVGCFDYFNWVSVENRPGHFGSSWFARVFQIECVHRKGRLPWEATSAGPLCFGVKSYTKWTTITPIGTAQAAQRLWRQLDNTWAWSWSDSKPSATTESAKHPSSRTDWKRSDFPSGSEAKGGGDLPETHVWKISLLLGNSIEKRKPVCVSLLSSANWQTSR